MQVHLLARILSGQDGAVWGGFLFRPDAAGNCRVYRLEELQAAMGEEAALFGEFSLDRREELCPHCNSVAFGREFFAPGDEFPLLYANIYNNCANAPDPRKGVTLVYRIRREGRAFRSRLVQGVAVDFPEGPCWRSPEGDVRPYGNFAIDRAAGVYYAFTMRDGDRKTRYFAFPLPRVSEGEMDGELGVPWVRLKAEAVQKRFDCPYQRFLQGACFHEGRIYTLEGFTDSPENPPALRVVDAALGQEVLAVDFPALGLTVEPEMVDFSDGLCYYGDSDGNFYRLDF